MMDSFNTFGTELRSILTEYSLTYASLGKVLNYDESYISKWVRGRLFPSENNLEKIIVAISTLMNETENKNSETFNEKSSFRFEDEVRNRLTSAYKKSALENEKNSNMSQTTHLSFLPVGDMHTVVSYMRSSLDEGTSNIEWIELIDLFSINNECRMTLAGIENGYFSMPCNESMKVKMIVDFSRIRDVIYDSVFLVHMLASLSGIDFELYSDNQANGKLISVSNNGLLVSANIINDMEAIAIVKDMNVNRCQMLYDKLQRFCTQESLVFKKISEDEWINQLYLQSLFSDKLEWIVGHFMEHLVPMEMVDSLLDRLDGTCTAVRISEMKQIHMVRSKVCVAVGAKIMIYRTAVTDFIINGELDFYNHKLILTVDERIACIHYIEELVQNSLSEVRMINDDLSKDFKNITNPCVFIAERTCYMRLANGRYENNLLLLKDKFVWNIFKKFYEEIWNNRRDVVIEEKEQILIQIDSCLQQLKLLR